jgi:hypothetical protein
MLLKHSLFLKPLVKRQFGVQNKSGSFWASYVQDRAMTVLSEESKEEHKKQVRDYCSLRFSCSWEYMAQPIAQHF